MTEPRPPGADRNRSMTALIVMTIVVLVFATVIVVYLYGMQGIGG